MDNKKWGKRFSTIFWWSLTILPFIIPLIQFIGYHLTFNSGITSASDLISYHSDISGSYDNILFKFMLNWTSFGFPFIRTMFVNLFTSIGLTSNNTISLLASAFSWMVSVQLYHLLFDFVAWFPRLVHSWMDRWCVE